MRVFTYVDDLVDGIYTLMRSDLEGPVNLGSDERVTVAELSMGAEAQGSKGAQEWRSKGDFTLAPLHPCTSAQRGWEAKCSLKEGIARTYPWVEEQVKAAREVV